MNTLPSKPDRIRPAWELVELLKQLPAPHSRTDGQSLPGSIIRPVPVNGRAGV